MVTNIEMDHHARWGSVAELRAAFEQFAAGAERAEFDERSPGPARAPPRGPRPPQPAQRPRGAGGGRAARASTSRRRRSRWPASRACGAGSSSRASATAPAVYDDYAHHPTEVRAALSALRELGDARLIAVFQPHLYSRTKAFAEEFGAALALADEVVVLDVYPAREEPVGELAGVDGLLVAHAAADRMGGRRVAGRRASNRREALLERRLGPGRVLVTIGAGDVFKLGEALVGSGAERGGAT